MNEPRFCIYTYIVQHLKLDFPQESNILDYELKISCHRQNMLVCCRSNLNCQVLEHVVSLLKKEIFKYPAVYVYWYTIFNCIYSITLKIDIG